LSTIPGAMKQPDGASAYNQNGFQLSGPAH
jgi:hypothetical protein